MPFDPNGLLEALANGLSAAPSALIAAALLAGPTAIWLITRFTHPPEARTLDDQRIVEHVLWVCESCHSINEAVLDQCYRCHRTRSDTPEVVIDVGPSAVPGVGVAVGPGRAMTPVPPPSWLGGPFQVPQPDDADPAQQDVHAAMLAVNPGTFDADRATQAAGRAPGPANPRPRRAPQGAGVAKSKRNSRMPGS